MDSWEGIRDVVAYDSVAGRSLAVGLMCYVVDMWPVVKVHSLSGEDDNDNVCTCDPVTLCEFFQFQGHKHSHHTNVHYHHHLSITASLHSH